MKWSVLLGSALLSTALMAAGPTRRFPNIPADYLREADHIPDFWKSTLDEVNRFLDQHVHTGTLITIGTTAGGRRIRVVVYGQPRSGKGTTTFSGSLGFGDTRAYVGPDSGKRVFMGMAGVHCGEFEGIVGMVNLLCILETGNDLKDSPNKLHSWDRSPAVTKARAPR